MKITGADLTATDATTRRWRSGDLLDIARRMTAEELRLLLSGMTEGQKAELIARWYGFENDGQREPPGDWRIWLIRAGRGFGKTRAGSEWVSEIARNHGDARIALVAATQADGQRVMIDGPSGLIAVARSGEETHWVKGRRELRFASGAVATLYSAEAGEELRGPEHDFAWCDELAKWRRGEAAWDNLVLGLRLGERPRAVVTTTPRVNAVMQRVLAAPGLAETLGRTRDNPWLPAYFVSAMLESYGGTRLGRQELDGELLEDIEGALWTRGLIERCRIGADEIGKPVRVVIGVDPPATAHGDACGIVVAALLRDGRVAVVEDASVETPPPAMWAQAVAAAAARWGADRVVAESNMGGEMVEGTLRQADCALPVVPVHASVGKARRAEPVAIAYERGDVVHAAVFAALEDQLCGLQVGGAYAGPGRSPDRADACVWALAALLEGRRKGKVPGITRV
ncbi:Large terminase phage packaging protein [Sphingopyxis sp. YR583]|uniref:phage terminase large subunit family protein n=1 Tax=Sphingopyxis sp. YR583 TaxID=1881047 RepID=UPI0008A7ADE6|nr:terminase family protein [Sphingopyxis sp. YR583]SEH17376.1 Large terminase phage packaging protein [Sphingopyxis sp. YR583]